MTLTYGELFTGIGGMSLGLERAGWQPRWFAENNAYCSRVLAKHWPTVPNLGDVKKIDWSTVERPDLVAGGYPCPTFSQAARGRNTAVDLWPQMRRAIIELSPRLVLIENVAAHLGRGFAGVVADLHALGMAVEWSVVAACSVGASHTRRRLFAVAYPYGESKPVFPVNAEVAWVQTVAGSRGRWGLPSTDDARADDGIPDRVDRARALGNAVVPQVAEWIGARLLEQLVSA